MAAAAAPAVLALQDELRQLERRERELEHKVKVLDWKEKGKDPKTAPKPEGESHERAEDGEGSKRRAVASAQEPQDQKPARLSSSVVPTKPIAIPGERPPPTDAANTDEKLKSRNKRLFGSLFLGTLQKAQLDLKSDAKLTKRQEIDKELETKVAEEKEEQRRKWAEEKEQNQKALEEVKKLKAEKEAAIIAEKKGHYERLYANFTKTKAVPPVYWAPRSEDAKKDEKEKKEAKADNEGGEQKDAEMAEKKEDAPASEGAKPLSPAMDANATTK